MAGKKHVLVVDDDATTRLLEALLLSDAGYAVTQASDGSSGIQELDRAAPDLVLLDLRLPGADGWEVLEHIVNMPIRPRVIVVTGMPSFKTPEHLKPHVDYVVQKPFEPVDLLQLCARVCAV
jgi:CheY-like chemotaxis protein